MRIQVYALLIVSLFLFLTHLSGQTNNTNLSNGFIFEGEPFLAVNPNDARHLVVAWMGFDPPDRIAIFTRASFDGGDSWSNEVKIPHENNVYSSADPTMDFNSQGEVFLAYIDFDRPAEIADSGAIYLRKSTDGGLSWGPSHLVMAMDDDPGKKAVDRPWLVIDKSGGPCDGNIYITSMSARGTNNPPYHPYLNRSSDGGVTWKNWKYLDTTNFLAGLWIPQPMPTPAVAFDGRLHAVYPSWVFTQNPYPQYLLASSSDCGTSFSYHSVYVEYSPAQDSLIKKGYLLRTNPYDTNHLTFLYLAEDYGSIDVLMRESSDGGQNWSSPIRVNDDPVSNNRIQDLVWADFDLDGDLAVAWRDRRNAPDTTFTTSSEIWGAVRPKDSATFSPNFLISDTLVPYDTILGASSGNDFMSVQFIHDTLYVVWGSNQDGSLDIWFQRFRINNGIIVGQNSAVEITGNLRIFPNPVRSSLTIESGSMLEQVELFDLGGRKVLEARPFSHQTTLDLSDLPIGTYVLKVDNGSIHTRKIIKD